MLLPLSIEPPACELRTATLKKSLYWLPNHPPGTSLVMKRKRTVTLSTPFSTSNFSLLSRSGGGRPGEEGRGDEGAHGATLYLTK